MRPAIISRTSAGAPLPPIRDQLEIADAQKTKSNQERMVQTTKKRRGRRKKMVESVLLFVLFVSSWFAHLSQYCLLRFRVLRLHNSSIFPVRLGHDVADPRAIQYQRRDSRNGA